MVILTCVEIISIFANLHCEATRSRVKTSIILSLCKPHGVTCYLRDKFSCLHVDDTVADLRLNDQVWGLVAARRLGLVYPLRERAVYSEVAAVATYDDNVLPVGTEQRCYQQAASIERLVHSALRSPPFFRLEQRHFLRNAFFKNLRRHCDADKSNVQLMPGTGGLHAGGCYDIARPQHSQVLEAKAVIKDA